MIKPKKIHLPKKLNVPNKLTLMRILLAPIFLIVMFANFPHHVIVALVIFVIASVTDLLDGNIARKRGLVTEFGKFLDPLADKMLITAAYIAFIQLSEGGGGLKYGYGIMFITFIVLTREFLITSLRLAAVKDKNIVIAASIYGKLKTVFQMISIIATITAEYAIEHILYDYSDLCYGLRITYNVLLWFATLLAIISGIQYYVANRNLIDTNK